MFKNFVAILLLCFLINGEAFSQKKIKVKSFGYGVDSKSAIDNALRDALEQSLGVYLNSTSKIENNELINDEISIISRGEVIEYKILSENIFPNGGCSVHLKVTLTKNQLLRKN